MSMQRGRAGSDGTPGPDLLAAARQLGVQAHERKMLRLVEDMLKKESLPPCWTAEYEKANNRWVYTNMATHEAQLEHPLIEYYRGALFMDKGGYKLLLRNMEKRKPTYDEVISECAYFGIPEHEDMYIQEVAELRLVCPLPPGWEEVRMGPGERSHYRHVGMNITLAEHPLDPYFRELRDRRRKELNRRRWAAVRAMQAMMHLHRKTMFSQMPQSHSRPGTPQLEGQAGQQEDPYLEELMAEWQAVNKSADKLATAVHRMASTVAQDMMARSQSGQIPALPPPPLPVGTPQIHQQHHLQLDPGGSSTAPYPALQYSHGHTAGTHGPSPLGAGQHQHPDHHVGFAMQGSTNGSTGLLPLPGGDYASGMVNGQHAGVNGYSMQGGAGGQHHPPPVDGSGRPSSRRRSRGSLGRLLLDSHARNMLQQQVHSQGQQQQANSAFGAEGMATDALQQQQQSAGGEHASQQYAQSTAAGSPKQGAGSASPATAVQQQQGVVGADGELSIADLDAALRDSSHTRPVKQAAYQNMQAQAGHYVPVGLVALQREVKARESGSNLVADGEQVNTLAASLRNSGRLAHLKQQALLPTAGHRPSGLLSSEARATVARVYEAGARLLADPAQLLHPSNFKEPGAGPGTHSTPAFEPAGSDSDEAIAARAKASLQALRGTLENAAALAAGLPPDTPAVLATLPKGWMDLVRTLPPTWADALRALPYDWEELLRSLPPRWLQTRRQLPDDWTDRLHYEHWPDLIAWLPPDWPDLLRTLPPDWGVIQKSLPGDWAEAVRELKPDWRNRLPAGPTTTSVDDPEVQALLSALPRGTTPDQLKEWVSMVQALPPDTTADQLQSLGGDWPALLAAVPPGVTPEQLRHWAELLSALPPGTEAAEVQGWAEVAKALPPGFADVLAQLPPNWAELIRVQDWPVLLGSAAIPPGGEEDWGHGAEEYASYYGQQASVGGVNSHPDEWAAEGYGGSATGQAGDGNGAYQLAGAGDGHAFGTSESRGAVEQPDGLDSSSLALGAAAGVAAGALAAGTTAAAASRKGRSKVLPGQITAAGSEASHTRQVGMAQAAVGRGSRKGSLDRSGAAGGLATSGQPLADGTAAAEAGAGGGRSSRSHAALLNSGSMRQNGVLAGAAAVAGAAAAGTAGAGRTSAEAARVGAGHSGAQLHSSNMNSGLQDSASSAGGSAGMGSLPAHGATLHGGLLPLPPGAFLYSGDDQAAHHNGISNSSALAQGGAHSVGQQGPQWGQLTADNLVGSAWTQPGRHPYVSSSHEGTSGSSGAQPLRSNMPNGSFPSAAAALGGVGGVPPGAIGVGGLTSGAVEGSSGTGHTGSSSGHPPIGNNALSFPDAATTGNSTVLSPHAATTGSSSAALSPGEAATTATGGAQLNGQAPTTAGVGGAAMGAAGAVPLTSDSLQPTAFQGGRASLSPADTTGAADQEHLKEEGGVAGVAGGVRSAGVVLAGSKAVGPVPAGSSIQRHTQDDDQQFSGSSAADGGSYASAQGVGKPQGTHGSQLVGAHQALSDDSYWWGAGNGSAGSAAHSSILVMGTGAGSQGPSVHQDLAQDAAPGGFQHSGIADSSIMAYSNSSNAGALQGSSGGASLGSDASRSAGGHSSSAESVHQGRGVSGHGPSHAPPARGAFGSVISDEPEESQHARMADLIATAGHIPGRNINTNTQHYSGAQVAGSHSLTAEEGAGYHAATNETAAQPPQQQPHQLGPQQQQQQQQPRLRPLPPNWVELLTALPPGTTPSQLSSWLHTLRALPRGATASQITDYMSLLKAVPPGTSAIELAAWCSTGQALPPGTTPAHVASWMQTLAALPPGANAVRLAALPPAWPRLVAALPEGTSPEQLQQWMEVVRSLPEGTTAEQLAQQSALAAVLPPDTQPEEVQRWVALAAALPPGTSPQQAKAWAAVEAALPEGTTAEQAKLWAALAAALPPGATPELLESLPPGWLEALSAGGINKTSSGDWAQRLEAAQAAAAAALASASAASASAKAAAAARQEAQLHADATDAAATAIVRASLSGIPAESDPAHQSARDALTSGDLANANAHSSSQLHAAEQALAEMKAQVTLLKARMQQYADHMPPGWEDLVQVLPDDWADRMHVDQWPALLGTTSGAAGSARGANYDTVSSSPPADGAAPAAAGAMAGAGGLLAMTAAEQPQASAAPVHSQGPTQPSYAADGLLANANTHHPAGNTTQNNGVAFGRGSTAIASRTGTDISSRQVDPAGHHDDSRLAAGSPAHTADGIGRGATGPVASLDAGHESTEPDSNRSGNAGARVSDSTVAAGAAAPTASSTTAPKGTLPPNWLELLSALPPGVTPHTVRQWATLPPDITPEHLHLWRAIAAAAPDAGASPQLLRQWVQVLKAVPPGLPAEAVQQYMQALGTLPGGTDPLAVQEWVRLLSKLPAGTSAKQLGHWAALLSQLPAPVTPERIQLLVALAEALPKDITPQDAKHWVDLAAALPLGTTPDQAKQWASVLAAALPPGSSPERCHQLMTCLAALPSDLPTERLQQCLAVAAALPPNLPPAQLQHLVQLIAELLPANSSPERLQHLVKLMSALPPDTSHERLQQLVALVSVLPPTVPPEQLHRWASILPALPAGADPQLVRQWVQMIGNLPANITAQQLQRWVDLASVLPADTTPQQLRQWSLLTSSLPPDVPPQLLRSWVELLGAAVALSGTATPGNATAVNRTSSTTAVGSTTAASVEAVQRLVHRLQESLQASGGPQQLQELLDVLTAQLIHSGFQPQQLRQLLEVAQALPPEATAEQVRAWVALGNSGGAELKAGTHLNSDQLSHVRADWVQLIRVVPASMTAGQLQQWMQLAGATATAGTSPEHLREWAILMAALPSSTNPAQLKQWAQVLGHLPAGTKPEAVLKALAIAQALPAGAQPEQAKEWEGLLTALPADTKAHHLAALPRDFAQLAQRLPKGWGSQLKEWLDTHSGYDKPLNISRGCQTDTTLFHQPSALSPSPPTSSFSLPDIHDALGQPSPGRTHPRAPSAHNQGRAGRIANAYGGWVGEGAGGGRAGRVRSRHGSSSNSGGVTSGAGHTSSDTNTREQQYSRRAGFASGNSATTQPGSSDGDNEEGVYRRSHTQQEVTPSYPDFDARPVPPEVRSRVLHMLDKDMQLGREEAWKEAPDERMMRNWAEYDVAHLKQRIVRAELARSELSARLVSEAKANAATVAALSHNNETLSAQNYALRRELAALREQLVRASLATAAGGGNSLSGIGASFADGAAFFGAPGSISASAASAAIVALRNSKPGSVSYNMRSSTGNMTDAELMGSKLAGHLASDFPLLKPMRGVSNAGALALPTFSSPGNGVLQQGKGTAGGGGLLQGGTTGAGAVPARWLRDLSLLSGRDLTGVADMGPDPCASADAKMWVTPGSVSMGAKHVTQQPNTAAVQDAQVVTQPAPVLDSPAAATLQLRRGGKRQQQQPQQQPPVQTQGTGQQGWDVSNTSSITSIPTPELNSISSPIRQPSPVAHTGLSSILGSRPNSTHASAGHTAQVLPLPPLPPGSAGGYQSSSSSNSSTHRGTQHVAGGQLSSSGRIQQGASTTVVSPNSRMQQLPPALPSSSGPTSGDGGRLMMAAGAGGVEGASGHSVTTTTSTRHTSASPPQQEPRALTPQEQQHFMFRLRTPLGDGTSANSGAGGTHGATGSGTSALPPSVPQLFSLSRLGHPASSSLSGPSPPYSRQGTTSPQQPQLQQRLQQARGEWQGAGPHKSQQAPSVSSQAAESGAAGKSGINGVTSAKGLTSATPEDGYPLPPPPTATEGSIRSKSNASALLSQRLGKVRQQQQEQGWVQR